MENNLFAERLIQCRLQKGYSLSQVSFYLHISKSLLSNYEHGRSYPNARNLIVLANFFHVSADYLLGIEALTLPASFIIIPVYDCRQRLLSKRAVQCAYKDSFYFKQGHFLYLIIKLRSFQAGCKVLIRYHKIWQLGTVVHHEHQFFIQVAHAKKDNLLALEQLKDNLVGKVCEMIEIFDEIRC